MVNITKVFRHSFLGFQRVIPLGIVNTTQYYVGRLPVDFLEDGDQIIMVMKDQDTIHAVIRVKGSQYTAFA
jgi:hypothetical protein